jgi:hypothetical protein
MLEKACLPRSLVIILGLGFAESFAAHCARLRSPVDPGLGQLLAHKLFGNAALTEFLLNTQRAITALDSLPNVNLRKTTVIEKTLGLELVKGGSN